MMKKKKEEIETKTDLKDWVIEALKNIEGIKKVKMVRK
jgi:hypothetical protein